MVGMLRLRHDDRFALIVAILSMTLIRNNGTGRVVFPVHCLWTSEVSARSDFFNETRRVRKTIAVSRVSKSPSATA